MGRSIMAMRRKLLWLPILIVSGVSLVALWSAVRVPERRYHFFSLLESSWQALMQFSSTSTFGLLYFSLGAAFLIPTSTLLYNRFGKGQEWREASVGIIPQVFISFIAVPVLSLLAYANFIVSGIYEDHHELVSYNRILTEKLIEAKKTGMKLTVRSVATGVKPNGNTIVFVFATVSNSGPPSIADQWSLEMMWPTGERKTFQPTVIIKGPVGVHVPNGTAMYDVSDMLYRKTTSNPVATGAQVTGFLVFELPDMTQAQAEVVGVIYRLSCADISGNHISAEQSWNANPNKGLVPYVPGAAEPRFEK